MIKRFLFTITVLAAAIILIIEPPDEPTFTESPDFYAVEAHPVEDTAHVIVVNR